MITLLRSLLPAVLVCSLLGCPLPGEPDPTPPPVTDYGYGAERLNLSNPRECEPDLLTFGELGTGYVPAADQEVPPLPEDCTLETGNFRIAELSGVTGGSFVLHLYRATIGTTTVSVYGETGRGAFETILDCADAGAVANRIEITGVENAYSRLFIRLGIATDIDYLPGENLQLAAYDDIDRGRQAPFIDYNYLNPEVKRFPDQFDGQPDRLSVSCDGTSFQRLILSTCGEDSTVLKKWAELTGVPPSEQYYSDKGHVVALTVPPGMDLNTTGGAVTRLRPRNNTGNGTVEPDYIVNLFDPRDPDNFGGDLPTAGKDPEIIQADGRILYFQTLFRDLQPRQNFNYDLDPLRIAIIDSGVDVDYSSDPAEALWRLSPNQKRTPAEYVLPNRFGFDFIENDYTPNDPLPHGNAVTWSILNNYRGDRPLDLIHLKTFGREGAASYFGTLVSLYEANRVGSDLINMSWGIYTPKAPEALTCAVERALADDILLVTSAGNDNEDLNATPQWPAAYAEAYPDRIFSVASYWYGLEAFDANSDPDAARKKDYSNFGPPRVNVAGYFTNPIPTAVGADPYFPIGTSISAPLIIAELANRINSDPGDPTGALMKTLNSAPNLSGVVVKERYLPLPPRNPQP